MFTAPFSFGFQKLKPSPETQEQILRQQTTSQSTHNAFLWVSKVKETHPFETQRDKVVRPEYKQPACCLRTQQAAERVAFLAALFTSVSKARYRVIIRSPKAQTHPGMILNRDT
ncbi:hypothetical protein BaRGS_00013873 [Batillaria attramentaria]|uniref:Uncharacterized protein n=1 Tax=Batillaria attramentaria TaxID=370345 RepID=A0ABD0L7F9_9CAEN